MSDDEREQDELAIRVNGELPIEPWRLADSPWPRSAGDRRNTRQADVEGPRVGRVWRVSTQAGEGLAVAGDGSLRMSGEGRLFAFDPSGAQLWSLALHEPDEPDEPDDPEHDAPPRRWQSAPLVLADGTCVVSTSQGLVFVAAGGERLAHVELTLGLDDSGPAINLAPDGTLILTTPYGDVLGLRGGNLIAIARGLGYDLVPPAIDDDGSLVVAGYAGKGLARLAAQGTLAWRSGLAYADLLPTIDRAGRAAGGSMNEKQSWIVAREGQRLATYPAAAVFAATDDGWVALAEHSLAGLGPEGQLRWRRDTGARGRWGRLGPALDRAGRILAPCGDTLVGLEAEGRERFVVDLPGPALDLALIGEGRAALALAEGLFFVE
ncbi:PQQ-binding-like beta-propeller repeat protein [Nannocystaceae bacterium ST9]